MFDIQAMAIDLCIELNLCTSDKLFPASIPYCFMLTSMIQYFSISEIFVIFYLYMYIVFL